MAHGKERPASLPPLPAVVPNTTLACMVLNDDGTNTGTPIMTSFDNQTVAEGDVLFKYTPLTATPTLTEWSTRMPITSGSTTGSTRGLTGWQNGDFNYDGVVNGDDYTLIDNAFNTQGSVSFASASAGPTEMIASDTAQVAAAVPEPGSAALISILAASLLTRKRR